MSGHDLASFLLFLMPVAFGVKTVVFLVLTVVMWRQANHTPLGTWIVRLFGALTVTSLAVTNLAHYLYRAADADDVDSVRTWTIVVGTALVPFAVSACGIMIALWDRRIEHAVRHDPARRIEAEAQEIEQHARDIGQTVRCARYDGKDGEE